jgi:hypothetical protein
VEGSGELSGAVSDQEAERVIVAESHREVAGGLGGSWSGGVGGDSGEMDSSCCVFDYEQDMESVVEGGVDACEVGFDDCFGL